MKVTIEEIDGKQYTVIIRDGVYKPPLKPRPLDWNGYSIFNTLEDNLNVLTMFDTSNNSILATALPPLPRNPKPEDAKLIYRYMAEGLYIFVGEDVRYDEFGYKQEIHHVEDDKGNKVEVATDDK